MIFKEIVGVVGKGESRVVLRLVIIGPQVAKGRALKLTRERESERERERVREKIENNNIVYEMKRLKDSTILSCILYQQTKITVGTNLFLGWSKPSTLI